MKHSRNHIIFRFIPFFFRFVQIDLRSGVLHAFFSRRQEKKVPLYNQSFFVISPVRSNPFPQFFTGSFAVDFGDHLRSRIICGPFWGSFAVSGSFAVGDHLRYCTVPPRDFAQKSLRGQLRGLGPRRAIRRCEYRISFYQICIFESAVKLCVADFIDKKIVTQS